LIHTFHGHQFQGYFTGSLSRAFVAIERKLARFTDLIITVTPTIRDQLINDYQIADASKIRVVPLGFDFSWTDELAASRGWLRGLVKADDSTILLGTVCRLTEIKNLGLLLRSFARLLQDNHSKLHLVIVGDGELRSSLGALAAQLGIPQHVTFAGIIRDRARIFADLDVTCLTSRNEGSPLCLIESIAAGVPVVATRVGGVADVVTSTLDGELVRPDDEQAFAAALGRATATRRRLSTDRICALKAHFSISQLVRNMEGIYAELLERRALSAAH
jgi:glycosyltransferase involved in cell wall biosynthesis